jgi:hypothetical protein
VVGPRKNPAIEEEEEEEEVEEEEEERESPTVEPMTWVRLISQFVTA